MSIEDGDGYHTGDDALMDMLGNVRGALEENVNYQDDESVEEAIQSAQEYLEQAEKMRLAQLQASLPDLWLDAVREERKTILAEVERRLARKAGGARLSDFHEWLKGRVK